MSSASHPVIVADNPAPYKTVSHTLTWATDPAARLTYAIKADTVYVVGINRGHTFSGTQLLEAFQPIAGSRRIKAIGVDFLTIGFWEKMVERKLVHDWGMENPSLFL